MCFDVSHLYFRYIIYTVQGDKGVQIAGQYSVAMVTKSKFLLNTRKTIFVGIHDLITEGMLRFSESQMGIMRLRLYYNVRLLFPWKQSHFRSKKIFFLTSLCNFTILATILPILFFLNSKDFVQINLRQTQLELNKKLLNCKFLAENVILRI